MRRLSGCEISETALCLITDDIVSPERLKITSFGKCWNYSQSKGVFFLTTSNESFIDRLSGTVKSFVWCCKDKALYSMLSADCHKKTHRWRTMGTWCFHNGIILIVICLKIMLQIYKYIFVNGKLFLIFLLFLQKHMTKTSLISILHGKEEHFGSLSWY